MKKLILIFTVLVIVKVSYGQPASQKSLLDYGEWIEIRDSSMVDTNNYPLIIMKPVRGATPVGQYDKDTEIRVWFKDYQAGQESFYRFDHSEFDDFANNSLLRTWIKKALGKHYNHKYTYDANNNRTSWRRYFIHTGTDTTWVQEKDTLIYDGSNNQTDQKKVADDSTW